MTADTFHSHFPRRKYYEWHKLVPCWYQQNWSLHARLQSPWKHSDPYSSLWWHWLRQCARTGVCSAHHPYHQQCGTPQPTWFYQPLRFRHSIFQTHASSLPGRWRHSLFCRSPIEWNQNNINDTHSKNMTPQSSTMARAREAIWYNVACWEMIAKICHACALQQRTIPQVKTTPLWPGKYLSCGTSAWWLGVEYLE